MVISHINKRKHRKKDIFCLQDVIKYFVKVRNLAKYSIKQDF
jgi:hypothetical protein